MQKNLEQTITVNLNDYILFTPTDFAHKKWREYYNLYGSDAPKKCPNRIQLWEFMYVFGKYFTLGAFDTNNIPMTSTEIKIERVP